MLTSGDDVGLLVGDREGRLDGKLNDMDEPSDGG